MSIEDLAELYARINDWGAEQHCGVPLWDRVRPPAAPKVNGNATPEPKANGKTTAAPIERQATPKPKANGKAAAMPTAQPTPPERQGQAKAEPEPSHQRKRSAKYSGRAKLTAHTCRSLLEFLRPTSPTSGA